MTLLYAQHVLETEHDTAAYAMCSCRPNLYLSLKYLNGSALMSASLLPSCQTCLQCLNIWLVNVKDASTQAPHECLCTHKHMTVHNHLTAVNHPQSMHMPFMQQITTSAHARQQLTAKAEHRHKHAVCG